MAYLSQALGAEYIIYYSSSSFLKCIVFIAAWMENYYTRFPTLIQTEWSIANGYQICMEHISDVTDPGDT